MARSKLTQTLLFIVFLAPLALQAQPVLPRFEKDTVYTSCGFKIYKGLQLEFAKGLLRDGRFKFVKVKNGFLSRSLTNKTVEITKINKYLVSGIGTGYVDVTGLFNWDQGGREEIVLHIAFDHAIENSPVLPSEIVVPAHYRNTRPRDFKAERHLLQDIYEDKVIRRAEYERMKQQLDEQEKQ